MEAKRRQLIFLIGAILVAVIFISSYAAFSNNNNSASTVTTTIAAASTVFVTGSTNATITNYSDVAYVSVVANSSQSDAVSNVLLNLQSNGTVEDYALTGSTYQVVLSGISAYDLSQILAKQTGSNSIAVAATTDVQLPSTIVLYYTNVPIDLHLPTTNYTVYMDNVQSVGSRINVTISTLLYAKNESIYNGQFRVAYSPTSGNYTSVVTTTIKSNKSNSTNLTVSAVGSANATITNYSKTAYVAFSSTSNSVANSIANVISQLKTNGSIQSYALTNGTYQVSLSNISAYGLQQVLYRKTNASNAIDVGATANVVLPSNVLLHYSNKSITVTLPSDNYSVYMQNVKSVGSIINVSVSTLLYSKNQSIYNDKFVISYKG